jgi:hypothetical protein
VDNTKKSVHVVQYKHYCIKTEIELFLIIFLNVVLSLSLSLSHTHTHTHTNTHTKRGGTQYKIQSSVRPTTSVLSISWYCDMTPERQKCAVREAPQRHPLLDNPVNTFLLKCMTTIRHPLLGYVSVNMPDQQQSISVAGQWMCFLGGPCWRDIKDNEGCLQSVKFRVPARKDMSYRSTEEYKQ